MVNRYMPSQKRLDEVATQIRKRPAYMVLFDIADCKFEVYTRGEWYVQYSTWVKELMWDMDADHSDEEVVEAICGDEIFMVQV